MARRLTSLLAAAFLLAVFSVPAGATAGPPITGTINCTINTGTLTIRHGLGTTPSTHVTHIKGVVRREDSSCDNSGVTGGKAPITNVSVKLREKVAPGATCPLGSNDVTGKVQVKFWGLNPDGNLFTVAVDNTTIASVSVIGNSFTVTTAVQEKAAFVGQTLTINGTVSSFTGSCTDDDPNTAATFSGSVTSP